MFSSNDKAEVDLSDWSVEVLPVDNGSETVITLRTHEIVIENQSKIYKTLDLINKILFVVGAALLVILLGAVVAYSIFILNNLQIIEIVKSQQVPGSH